MAPQFILRMVMLETFFLTAVGAIIGMICATVFVAVTAEKGIHLGMLFNIKFAYGFGEIIYPQLSIDFLGIILILVLVSAVFSAILPMQKTLKIIK